LEVTEGFPIGGVMPEVENFYESAQRCFEVANDFLEEDIVLEAFELLTTNNCDPIVAHALGVSL